MVQSHLNSEINYKKHERFDKNDLNHETISYDFSINDNDIEIALGKLHESKIDNNILFINVYKIEDETVKEHIGIFELYKKDKENIYDEDNDIDIERLGELLFFDNNKENSNVDEGDENKSDENKSYENKSDEEESDEEESDEDEGEENKSDEDEGDENKSDEDEEDEADESGEDESDEDEGDDTDVDSDDDNITNYNNKEQNEWIQDFTNSTDYTIKDNEGGGDCFFAAVRDGLATIDRPIKVQELRKLLANEVTKELFNTYLIIYNNFIDEKENLIKTINILNNKLPNLLTKVKQSVKISEKKNLLNEIEDINKKLSNSKNELEVVNKQLNSEFYFMNNISNIEHFKELIKSNKFWADTWAVSTIERILNIKLVLLSSENYKSGDLNNVLLCGQLNDAAIEEQGYFDPSQYILLEYTGDHYKLINYNNKGALTYEELPLFIKKLIKEKCLETKVGPYYLIKEFREMVEDNKEQEEEDIILDLTSKQTNVKEDSLIVDIENSLKNEVSSNSIKKNKLDINIDLNDLEIEDLDKPKKKLYNDNIVFQFYSKSSGARLPGKGAGEKIPDNKLVDFAVLSKIPEWRKKLSNFWVEPFTLDGHIWSSVEHYYQASKFKKNNNDFYLSFTLDKNPNNDLSKDPVMAKAAGGKTGKYKGKLIRDKKIKIDDGFFENNNRNDTMKQAMKAKFTQNKELNTLLKETKNAKLQHYIRGSEPEIFNDLMEVRNEIM